jgi:hypothetical protein
VEEEGPTIIEGDIVEEGQKGKREIIRKEEKVKGENKVTVYASFILVLFRKL